MENNVLELQSGKEDNGQPRLRGDNDFFHIRVLTYWNWEYATILQTNHI